MSAVPMGAQAASASGPAGAPAGVLAGADPRVHVLDGVLDAARLASLDPGVLAAAGHERLVLAEPVPLGEDDELDVRFVRLLRDAISVTLRVDWTAPAVPFDVADVCHLQPPRSSARSSAHSPAHSPAHSSAQQEPGRQWRDRFRFGLCYYRRGPGFLLLKDTREASTGARFRLDEPRACQAFTELLDAVHVPSASPRALELAEVLAPERLVLRHGAWVTVLPFRMRRWPVPFDLV